MNNHAERTLIGCCLVEATYVQRAAAEGITHEAFTDSILGEAFSAAVTVACGSGVRPEDSTQAGVLQAVSRSNPKADLAALIRCANDLTTPAAQFPDALRSVVDAWRQRKTARALTTALAELKDGKPSQEVRDTVTTRLHDIDQAHNRNAHRSLSEVMKKVASDLDARLAGKDAGSVCGWNVPALDRNCRPIRRGELILIGGRPGLGKSALASWIALRATADGKRCAYFSLEMPAEDVATRMAEQLSGVCVDALSSAPNSIHARFGNGMMDVAQLSDRLAVVDCERSLHGIIARSDLLRIRSGLDLVVVDYAQRVDVPIIRGQLRDAAVGQVSARLKAYAIEHKVAVILVVALNRGSESEKRPPQLSDLRESGQLEYDADTVALLHRPQSGDSPGVSPGSWSQLEIHLPKVRGGRIGMASAEFHGPTKRFQDTLSSRPTGGDPLQGQRLSRN